MKLMDKDGILPLKLSINHLNLIFYFNLQAQVQSISMKYGF